MKTQANLMENVLAIALQKLSTRIPDFTDFNEKGNKNLRVQLGRSNVVTLTWGHNKSDAPNVTVCNASGTNNLMKFSLYGETLTLTTDAAMVYYREDAHSYDLANVIMLNAINFGKYPAVNPTCTIEVTHDDVDKSKITVKVLGR